MTLVTFDITYSTFSDMDRLNRFFEDQFVAHQIAIMHNRLEQAMGHLELVFELYRQHERDTDRLLLALYEKYVRQIPEGGAVLFFVREHHFIMKRLSELIRYMGKLLLDPEGTPLRRVPLFEEHCALKDMFDHHHARDRHFLFRYLDKSVPRLEKETVLAEMEARHREVVRNIQGQP